ncbi:penicillin acylase family protein [Bradyrhizobium sp. SZCCHNR3050]|uniref:penicillin acylase family protein n=1 Tax=Bradyrhizobium sp. SZCCHNR3050 TaxID=3057416 RepID=UPI0029161A0E|nr:penicillin acylase family protein [Bradyrhizobium sp. SZCCHNR3050]
MHKIISIPLRCFFVAELTPRACRKYLMPVRKIGFRKTVLRRVLFGVALALFICVVVIGGVLFWLYSGLPQPSETLVRPGTKASILVTRDDAGLPTIEAPTADDGAFGLGYVHAQDRLFQMDLTRRYGAGRLSEWFGRAGLGSDRFMRTLGLSGLVEKQYRQLSAPVQAMLRSYAEGVNAYAASGFRALSPDYYALNVGFEPWRPEDCLLWAKLIDIELTGNFRDELLHAQLLRKLPPADLDVLFPSYPRTAPVVLERTRAELDHIPIEQIYASLPDGVGAFEASNNWVLSGKRTASGKPLLANDPHLRFGIPSAWYLARVKTPTETLTGASAPGTPFILIGHNRHIAWGITATRSDVADLFIEKLDAANREAYLTPDGSEPFESRQEIIAVKGEAPIAMTVRSTRHGPVISDLAEFAKQVPSADHVLSLQATWLSSEDTSPEAAWGLSRAQNWDEFRQALRKLTAPQQNYVYADTSGNIGFIAPARIPIRSAGDGWLPVPGWDGKHDWSAIVPFDDLPASFNPLTGVIVTANNKLQEGDYPFLARDWIPPFRAERIKELLGRDRPFSADDMDDIQHDTVSLAARQLVPFLRDVKLSTPLSQDLAGLLQRWDARMAADRIEPLIFSTWLKELNRSLLQPRLGSLYQSYGSFHPDVIYLILTQHPDWCDDPATTETEACDAKIARAFDLAISQLVERLGQPSDRWRWGDAHHAIFSHPLWSRVPLIAGVSNFEPPAEGSTDTVSNAAISFSNDVGRLPSYFGSTMRMVVDLADLDASRFMIVPGQSGNLMSRHYGDLLPSWQTRQWLRFKKP